MLQDLSESEQAKARELIHRLLEVNIIVKDKNREDYALVRRHRSSLEAYFRFLGWELTIDERHECVFLHIPESGLRKRLDREQTLWLLVLRILYEEKRKGLSLSDFPMITLYELRSKYETFRLEWVNKTTLDKLIRLVTQFQLLDPLDDNNHSDDARFKLYHTWMYVIQADGINQLEDRLGRYDAGEEGGLFDEMDEAAASD
jgi:hypothetical protein